MRHEHYPDVLECGRICAGRMECHYEDALERERPLINAAIRKSRWLSRRWNLSSRGNEYLKTCDGFHIVVFEKPDGTWGGRVEDRWTGDDLMSRRKYKTSDDAKLAAFDAMVRMKRRRDS